MLDTEKKFRRISGCKDIWMPEVALKENIDIQKKMADNKNGRQPLPTIAGTSSNLLGIRMFRGEPSWGWHFLETM